MRLIITKHAQGRMDKYGFTEEQIKLAIQRGAKTRQTDGFLVQYTYIYVAYKVRNDIYIIKTVMLER